MKLVGSISFFRSPPIYYWPFYIYASFIGPTAWMPILKILICSQPVVSRNQGPGWSPSDGRPRFRNGFARLEQPPNLGGSVRSLSQLRGKWLMWKLEEGKIAEGHLLLIEQQLT